MSPNRRIVLNVIASYGRSLYALVVGLFTARWVLMSLGEVDFGLYGVVGGCTAFIQFINNLMSMAVVRFYAVSVGAANIAKIKEDGVEECRRWFSIALMLHTLVPLIVTLIGYPLGEWAVRGFLNIPLDRVNACVWVWRFTCFGCFIGMLNIPFKAMYDAKQELAELTIYSFVTTTVNAIVLYYMVSHPSDWLVRYAGWMCIASAVPQVIIGLRAISKYPECKLRTSYMFDWARIKQLLAYAASRFWTAITSVFSSQGQNILVNKYLGPSFNASMTIGGQVSAHSSTLSTAISAAFWPAIANTAGEGNEERVRKLSFRVCRLSTFMVLIFFIPLALEIDEVLRLWLKSPPPFASQMCIAIMFAVICERVTEGYWMAVMGLGRQVGYYSWVIGWAGISNFAITLILFSLGFGFVGICVSIVFSNIFMICARLYLGQRIANLSPRFWVANVMMPMLVVAIFALIIGIVCKMIINQSFLRICITTLACNTMILLLGWRFVISYEERLFLKSKISKFLKN